MDKSPEIIFNSPLSRTAEIDTTDHSEPVDVYTEMSRGELIQAAIELKTKLLKSEEQLRQANEKCFIDSLTGCYNRNYYEKFIDDNFNPSRNHNRIGIVFFDINDLKLTNDVHGHDAGDKLIIETANYLIESFRKDDIVIRIGGDEFVVICANSENDSIFKENLDRIVRKDIIPKSPSSIAFGASVYDKEQDKGLDDTKRRAGRLMYECKKQMKNTAD